MDQSVITGSNRLPLLFCAAVVFGCSESAPPPRSAVYFEGDPVALEAKLIQCQADPKMSDEDPECRAARVAANRIAAAEAVLRRARMEAESERKRLELRQQRLRAAEEAERRMQELRALAEEKLERGEFLTVEEANALGVDPTNPALVRQPETGGGDQSGTAGAEQRGVPDAALDLPPLEASEPDDASARPERPAGPRDLSEIRDALDDAAQESTEGDDSGG